MKNALDNSIINKKKTTNYQCFVIYNDKIKNK